MRRNARCDEQWQLLDARIRRHSNGAKNAEAAVAGRRAKRDEYLIEEPIISPAAAPADARLEVREHGTVVPGTRFENSLNNEGDRGREREKAVLKVGTVDVIVNRPNFVQ